MIQISWPYDIGNMPSDIRGTYRLVRNSDGYGSPDTPWGGHVNSSPNQQYFDGALYQIAGYTFSTLGYNDHIKVSQFGEDPLPDFTVESSLEVTFDNGETWVPRPLTLAVI